jgi:hypothetical protein
MLETALRAFLDAYAIGWPTLSGVGAFDETGTDAGAAAAGQHIHVSLESVELVLATCADGALFSAVLFPSRAIRRSRERRRAMSVPSKQGSSGQIPG